MALTSFRDYVGATVTLTSANTNYNLQALAQAVLDAETGMATGGTIPGAVRQVTIQSHPGIDSSGSNTADVLLGDAKLSTSRFGMVLQVGATYSDRSPINNVLFGNIYARSATAGQKLNICIYAG